jgi:aminoglycoside 6'-N-acetyltransferase I
MAGRHGLEIRGASAGDAAGIAELLALAGDPVPIPAMAAEAVAARLDAMRRMQGAVLLALEWGPPSGIVVLHWFQSLLLPRPTARITTLFVAPEARRRGVGRLLVKAASQAARVAGCDALEMQADCTPQFGEAAGFARHGGSLVRPLRKQGGTGEPKV